MFLKAPRASTDQRVRSLLQKAARRGYVEIVDAAVTWLDKNGDGTWLRSRTVIITFEECWPLAASLVMDRDLASKRSALNRATRASKQKDAAGLGALAYAYHEGDESMVECVPDVRTIKMVAEALKRPKEFFEWARGQSRTDQAADIVRSAQRYLSVATWPWDKACILAGALLAVTAPCPDLPSVEPPCGDFPYWVALDKHTPQGKSSLREIAEQVNSSNRKLIWAGFYCESAAVNRLLPSPWWEAEKKWRLRRAELSPESAEALWGRVRPLLCEHLKEDAFALKRTLEEPATVELGRNQGSLLGPDF
jgi:hypothetical protein